MGTRPKAWIYRCVKCEVRIAHENEVVRVVKGLTKFDRIFNVCEENGDLQCARCGHVHFTSSEDFDLENLMMKVQGFARTPLRALVYVWGISNYFCHSYWDKNDMGKVILRNDCIETAQGIHALNSTCDLASSLLPDMEVSQRNVCYLSNLVRTDEDTAEKVIRTVDSSTWSCAQKFEWFKKMGAKRLQEEVFNQTYDFVLVVEVTSGGYVVWTDYNSRGAEEVLVLAWLSSGGNMLFGQCGIPIGNPPSGERIDMNEIARIFREATEGVETNRQRSLASLAEKGHFLGWWEPSPQFPEYAKVKAQRALYNLSYPRWLFRSDFPQETFNQPLRRGNLGGNRSVTYVTNFKDKFLPRATDEASGDDEADEQSFYGIVRKRSRVLFREGIKVFQGLIEKNCRTQQRLRE